VFAFIQTELKHPVVGKIYLGTGMMVEIVEIGKCELARAAVSYDWYCHLM
jgi:hypothetical protein